MLRRDDLMYLLLLVMRRCGHASTPEESQKLEDIACRIIASIIDNKECNK